MSDRSSAASVSVLRARIVHSRVWVWAAVAMSILVCVILTGLHYREGQTVDETVAALADIRQARIDLTQGYLQAALAERSAQSYNREQGLALLKQAVGAFERASDRSAPHYPEVGAFRNEVNEFRSRLEDWSRGETLSPRAETELRIAFHRLERQAAQMDDEIMARLKARSDGLRTVFLWSMLGAGLLLAGICGAVYFSEQARRASEEALQQERERLVKTAAASPGVMLSLRQEPNGRTTFPYASPRVAELYGVSPEELAGDGTLLMDRVHPEDRSHVIATITESARTMTPWMAAYRYRHPLKGEIWIEGHSMPVAEPDGAIIWHGIVTDITERRRVEESQARSQKLEALGTLAGGIAHDFNNILAAINGNAALAIDDLPPGHPARQSLEEIRKAGLRATELVRRILVFSTPGEQVRQPLALGPAVEEALHLLRAGLPSGIEIDSMFEKGIPAVAADPVQIHQVVINLMTNAAHAIGARTGRIELRIDAVDVDSELAATSSDLSVGSYVRLSVTDDGCGIEPGVISRIFDPFYTTKPPGQGTGLGLSVVHGIMKSHGGAVAVLSTPGKGTTFHLYFPAVNGAVPEPVESPSVRAPRPETGARVLYVDDEEALVLLVERALKRLGYDVTGCTDPLQALRLFQAKSAEFDAVVTDLSMPGLSGFQLVRELRAIRPDIPVLMMSGYVRQEDESESVSLGIGKLLLKPDTIEDLGRALDRELRSRNNELQPDA